MKTKITKYIIIGVAVVSGVISWMTIDRAINVPNSSHWLIPSIFFSILFIAITLSAILIKNRYILTSMLAVIFLASLYFSFSAWHVLMLLLCFFLIWAGLERIASDSRLNIKFNISRSIRTGKTLIILALSIAITSQYYTEIKNNNQIRIIPELEMGGAVNEILPMMFPGLKDIPENDATVDQFIMEISKQSLDTFSETNLNNSPTGSSLLNNDQMAQIIQSSQEKIFEEERKNLSKMAGVPLSGNEKISDVFSGMINEKINSFFAPSLQSGSQPILPFLASLILFLTVAYLGSIFGSLMGYITACVFWLMRSIGLIAVSKVATEMEVIE